MLEKCIGCGGQFVPSDGPIHNYMLSSVGCWKDYGQILAREYTNPELFVASHRLTVDAYALQHPGHQDERRAYQSVRIHYVSLYLIFTLGRSHAEATSLLKKLAGMQYDPLPNPPSHYAVTVKDVLDGNEIGHAEKVEAWAKCAYEAWNSLMPFAEEMVSIL